MKVIQPREFNPRKTATVLVVLAFAFYFYYQRAPAFQFWRLRGDTMGTTYTVKLLDRNVNQIDAANLKEEIDTLLADINQQMSTYITNSEITVFNDSQETIFQEVSPDFATVAFTAVDLCRQTGGAFDPTLDPLINVWGFGHRGPQKQPDDVELLAARALSGCDKVIVSENGMIRKTQADVRLNLNAIAKGYGVDQVSHLIKQRGISNFMVEIGGEVFARGMSEKTRPWRIGIDRPIEGSLPGETIELVVQVDDVALASSGNYRNFMVNDQGVKIVHLLDPRSGLPVTSNLGSVSVIAQDCMTADALATALFVMGTEDGIDWVNQNDGIEAAFIEYAPDGSLKTSLSNGFEDYVYSDD